MAVDVTANSETGSIASNPSRRPQAWAKLVSEAGSEGSSASRSSISSMWVAEMRRVGRLAVAPATSGSMLLFVATAAAAAAAAAADDEAEYEYEDEGLIERGHTPRFHGGLVS